MPTKFTIDQLLRYSPADFERALRSSRPTKLEIAILKFNYDSELRTTTATLVSKQFGWRTFGAANRVYGRFAAKVAEQFGDRDYETALLTIVRMPPYQGQCGWKLLPAVARALERLGWVDPAESRDNYADMNTTYAEGDYIRKERTILKRNLQARKDCISKFGFRCCVCESELTEIYGPEVRGLIHVHHLEQLAGRGLHEVNPIRDLRPVCPNCHAVIHFGGVCRTIDEVRAMIHSTRSAASALRYAKPPRRG